MASKWGERWQLEVGDLCLFVGSSDIYKQLRHGLIYQVVGKEAASSTSLSQHKYVLRVAFDVESPSGSHTEVFNIFGTRSLKKLSLLDLATLRLHLDDFIRWWAGTQGMEDTGDRPEDGQYGPAVAASGESPDQGTAPTEADRLHQPQG